MGSHKHRSGSSGSCSGACRSSPCPSPAIIEATRIRIRVRVGSGIEGFEDIDGDEAGGAHHDAFVARREEILALCSAIIVFYGCFVNGQWRAGG